MNDIAKRKLSEIIFMSLGEASMCWSEIPTGIFESDRARDIGCRLIEEITEMIEENEEK